MVPKHVRILAGYDSESKGPWACSTAWSLKEEVWTANMPRSLTLSLTASHAAGGLESWGQCSCQVSANCTELQRNSVTEIFLLQLDYQLGLATPSSSADEEKPGSAWWKLVDSPDRGWQGSIYTIGAATADKVGGYTSSQEKVFKTQTPPDLPIIVIKLSTVTTHCQWYQCQRIKLTVTCRPLILKELRMLTLALSMSMTLKLHLRISFIQHPWSPRLLCCCPPAVLALRASMSDQRVVLE